MKKLLIAIIMLITTALYSRSVLASPASYYEKDRSDYQTNLVSLTDPVNYLIADELSSPITSDELNFDHATLVYNAKELFTIQSEKYSDILKYLETCPYQYDVPVARGQDTFVVTICRGASPNTYGQLSEEDLQLVKDREGKLYVSQVVSYHTEMHYLSIEEQKSPDINAANEAVVYVTDVPVYRYVFALTSNRDGNVDKMIPVNAAELSVDGVTRKTGPDADKLNRGIQNYDYHSIKQVVSNLPAQSVNRTWIWLTMGGLSAIGLIAIVLHKRIKKQH